MKRVVPVVTGVGQCCWDTLAVVERWPAEDSKTEVGRWHEEGGGPVATALVALARLGMPGRFLGVVGGDELGPKIRRSLRDEGIEVGGLVTRPNAASQRAFIVVVPEQGSRTVFWQRPTGAPLQPAELPTGFLAGSRFLLLDGLLAEASLAAAERARAAGVTVMLDAGRDRPGMRELALQSDYLVAAERFLLDLGWDGSPDGFRTLAPTLGTPTVTVTCGSRGSLTWSDGQLFSVPAFPVAVLDTTGAGDAFHGGYLYGLLQGWELDVTVAFAAGVAALACRGLGGRATLPGLAEARAFLAVQGFNLPASPPG